MTKYELLNQTRIKRNNRLAFVFGAAVVVGFTMWVFILATSK